MLKTSIARKVFTLLLLSAMSQYLVAQSPDREFGIGSIATSLNVEHWAAGRESDAPQEVKFEPGKVYVIEFWATWCGPCIVSMPYLAGLQKKYGNEKLQVIGVSDESKDVVDEFLAEERDGERMIDTVSAYWLACDPDGSVSRDYLEAASIYSIPHSFLVGKTGVIEWLGLPQDLDEPLKAVLSDMWDREVFREQYGKKQSLSNLFQSVIQLAQANRHDQAVQLLKDAAAGTDDEAIKKQIETLQHALHSRQPNKPESLDFYHDRLERLKREPRELFEFTLWLRKTIEYDQSYSELIAPSIASIDEAVEEFVVDAEPYLKANLLHSAARLHQTAGNIAKAIEYQKLCVELGSQASRPRQQAFLDELSSLGSDNETEY